MKLNRCLHFVLATSLVALPFAGRATVFFNDTFGGSTLNSATPADPDGSSTAYQMLSGKSWSGESIAANDLRVGMVATGSGVMECQALFSTNPIALVSDGDYIQLTVTFTNTTGLLTNSSSAGLGFGLFNSGGVNGSVKPVPGGLSGTLDKNQTTAVTGNAQGWKGYFAYMARSGSNSRIYGRDTQTGSGNNNQGTATAGTSSSPQNPNPSQIGGNHTSTVNLTGGDTLTEVLRISLVGSDLAITNTLYSGPDANGTVLDSYGSVATGAGVLTSAFDSLSWGYRAAAATTMDVSSIQVDGSVTTISGPPAIDVQPVNVTVATNGSCYFEVEATGFSMIYQWYRNGAALSDGGNISGAKSSMLVIDNASTADQLSVANGYYCVITGAGGYSTNSTTNSLTLVRAKNLVWNGNGSTWDFSNLYWNDLGNSSNPTNFNFGDSVTFNATGSGNPYVTLSDKFLSAAKWIITGSSPYAFDGSGYFAGAGQLIFNSSASGIIQMDVANAHTGGTIVSNDNSSLTIYCLQYQVLGNGPLTLAKPGIMEFTVAGGSSLGIPGDVVVNDDFTIQFDGVGAYAGVFLGNLSGTSGKTLTLAPADTSTTNRYRVYGNNTVCDANIAINPTGTSTSQAQYDGTVLAPYGSGTQTYNGVISGYGGIVQRGGTTILNGANTYSGGTTPTTASIGLGNNSALGTGPLVLAPEAPNTSGSGTVFASGGARTIATTLLYPSGTNNLMLIIGGTNNITFTSAINLNGADGQGNPGSRTMQIDNTGATTLSGVISDSSANNIGFTKTGSGTLYLNGANTYGGSTTNSAGTLAGSGSLTGPVVVKSGASIGGGSSSAMGTLTIGGSLTIESGGGGFFRLNKGNLQTADKVSVSGALSSSGTGTITVTNLGATLNVGDSFTLFNKAVTGGSTLAVVGGGVSWTNKLAVDGTIQVVPGVATNPTNIVFSVSGSTLSLSWPSDHTGWTLQVQTNSLAAGLQAGGTWTAVPGSTATNMMDMPVDPANGSVFYRLIYQP